MALALRSSTRALPLLTIGIGLGAAAIVDAVGHRASAVGPPRRRARGRSWRWQPPVAARSPPGRPGPRPRRAATRGVGRRRRRARRDAGRLSRAAAARRRVRCLPLGLHRRSAAARADHPPAGDARPAAPRLGRGDGPAVRPRRPLPGGLARDRVDRPDRPPARRRHRSGSPATWRSTASARRARRPPARCSPRPPPIRRADSATRWPTATRSSTGRRCRWSTSRRCRTRRCSPPVAPVELVPVRDPVPVVRAADDVTLVSGSGDGLVDLAASGLITGDEVIRYSGSLQGDDLLDADRRRPAPDRHRLQPVPRPPLAGVAGRHRVHRDGRRAGDVAAPDSGDARLDVFPGAALDTAHRLGAGRTAARRGHVVRRAVRLPPGGPPGDGRRRRPDTAGVGRARSASASTSRSRPIAPSTTSPCCNPVTG